MLKIFQSRATKARLAELRRNKLLIHQSGLFDPAHYRRQLGAVQPLPKDLVGHYLSEGYRAGLDPSDKFSSAGYSKAFRLDPQTVPLLHHIERCLAAVRRHPDFDLAYYLSTYPDVARSEFDPAWHFLIYGGKESRRPSLTGDGLALAQTIGLYEAWAAPDAGKANEVAANASSPAAGASLSAPPEHPVGGSAGREAATTAPRAETSASPAAESGLAGNPSTPLPLEQQIRIVAESELFDVGYYLVHNEDLAKSGVDPLAHYVQYGGFEGRNPNALFQSAWYLNHHQAVYATGLNPLVHYVLQGATDGLNPSPMFDSSWYLSYYNDVRDANLNPLAHFMTHGKREGRLPKEPAEPVHLVGQRLSPYDAWLEINRYSDADRKDLQRRLSERKGRLPTISLITAVYNTDRALLLELVESVLAQVHTDWELCLCDDGSPSAHVGALLDEVAARDERIKVRRLPRNGGISVATNGAVELATGPIIAFLDHDDLLTPDCVGELACYYADHPDADIVYSDDDKIDMAGRRYAPQFKPDWSPVLLLSFMYISHIFSVRKDLFTRLGGFRTAFDGSQDYDFALRAAEQVRHVGHVPKVLYHWRAAPGSTASSADTKPRSLEAGRLAVEQAMHRRGYTDAKVIHPSWAEEARVGMFDIHFPDTGPKVCIVIPTRNQVGYLRRCVESLARTTYRDFEVFIIDNESDDPETLAYFAELRKLGKARVERIPNRTGKFSYAGIHNDAVKLLDAEYLLFLNNDTEVVAPEWLSQMVGYARMPGVGAVGARLYFEDGTLQHAGIVHGYHEGLVGHAFRNLPPYDWGYLGFVRTSREYSGVTAACMLTPRALFAKLGGFDEANFSVAYNDVDYCYRIVDAGLRCVYCATAELFHYEGKSRGYRDNPQERVNFRRLYGERVDPWYNRNLTLEHEAFQVEAVHAESTAKGAIGIVAVSHNLNHEGAPITLMDLLVGLKEQGHVSPVVISPTEGPLRKDYESAGIKVIVLDRLLLGVVDDATLGVALEGLGALFKALDAQVVIANTLQTFWAIAAAHRVGLPSMWCQHESEPWETYFDHLPDFMRSMAYASFGKAYRVLYVAEATRRAWRALETRGNFKIIRHGIPLDRLNAEVTRWSRQASRSKLALPDNHAVFTVIGTVCRRKGQLDLVRAYAALPLALQRKVRVQLVGKVGEADYGQALDAAVQGLDPSVRDHVVVTGGVDDVFLYYSSSDVFVCTSLVESAPRVLVEAMACSLPIITTPVFGIPELVKPDINALFYEPGKHLQLAQLMERLITDDAERRLLGANSRPVLDGQPGFAEMVSGYARSLRQAVLVGGETAGT